MRIRACGRVRVLVCVYECTSAGVCLRACRLTYPVRHAQAPYCLCPLWLHHIFRHYLTNGTIFENKSLKLKCAFWFSLLLFQKFVILRQNSRDIVVNVKTSSCKVSVIFCRILIKRKFSRPIFKKSSNIKFHQNPSIGSRVVPCGQTDMTKLIVVFHNFSNAPNDRSSNSMQQV